MIGIITIIVVCIIVMYIQNRKFNQDKNRINELENRLEQYYKERENRLKDNDLIK
jgi:Tfp pilus assembly protein PilE